jgi:hypothetical protein
MLWQDRAYLAVAGAGSVVSIVHYFATAKSITGPVPIHFNFFGTPDRFAAPWSLALYPLLCICFGVAAAAVTLSPTATSALPPNSAEQILTRASLLCGYGAVLTCQVCAARIAEGSSSKLPSAVLGVMYAGIGGSLVAVLAAKYFA